MTLASIGHSKGTYLGKILSLFVNRLTVMIIWFEDHKKIKVHFISIVPVPLELSLMVKNLGNKEQSVYVNISLNELGASCCFLFNF